jgi:hypothetical protein
MIAFMPVFLLVINTGEYVLGPHSVPLSIADVSESRGVYTPLRGTPPSRFSAFCCGARLREMAIQKTCKCIG